jgi:hypothetical protein
MESYRDMEKLFPTDLSDSLVERLQTLPIMEALQIMPEPVVLRRRLQLFDSAMGLAPNIAGIPDPEYILHIFEGAGHVELIRSEVGPEFKNFENFLRGKHATSAGTWTRILQVLGTDEQTGDLLRALAHGQRDGPLLPSYIAMGRAFEGAFVRVYRTLTSGLFLCQCCGVDLFNDARAWWPKQPLTLMPDACRFVDRLLATLIGGMVLSQFFASALAKQSIDSDMLEALANVATHPIGNWMTVVRTARGLRMDWELLPEPVVDARSSKWRHGVDLLPLKTGLKMIEGSPFENRLKHGLLAARVLALAVDIVRATAVSERRPPRSAAQEIVFARLKKFLQNVNYGFAEHMRRNTKATQNTGVADATLLNDVGKKSKTLE